uniref:C2H2-type domain-containing protein n=1 Tax=Timema cristinae TaxID=61476 RepID=A0A7R9D320_TIMCR|nr:unnamed protein product [Timema cristinae]
MKASKDILNRPDGEEETCSFTCEHCGKMYKRKTGLKRHLEFECGKQPQFPRMCDIYFQPLESLSSAICNTIQNETCNLETTAQNVSKYHCPNCGKVYSYNRSLRRHLRLECGKEPLYQCPHCPRRMSHKSMSKFWKEKDQIQFINTFEYPINDSRTGNIHKEQEHLMRERINITGTNFIERKFVCPKCKKAYKNKNHLGRHLKLECGVEPQFACQMCFRRFTHKHNMLSHPVFWANFFPSPLNYKI